MQKIPVAACLLVLLIILSSSAFAKKASYGSVSFDTSVHSLDMGSQSITDFESFYQFLEKFSDLTRVDMFETTVRSTQINEMTRRFPQIEFGWTMQFAEHIVRTDCTAFSTLHYSNASTHGDADISLVRYCHNLKALDIGHNAVTDLSFLYDLPELRVLIIACNQVEDITPIASLKHLEYLEMFTNKVRDISALTGLEHLMDLNIAYNYIADISPILTLSSLKRLWSCRSVNRGSNVSLSYAQIDQIKEAIPGIELNNLSNPTGGTWREHPHFDVIHSMFRTTIYEPFEDSFDVPDTPKISVEPTAAPRVVRIVIE